jgi:2-keto-4-pentenoate hydratase/2-oxohepta-3-ene-1,7-dioic acid hydratase in catechol pathway
MRSERRRRAIAESWERWGLVKIACLRHHGPAAPFVEVDERWVPVGEVCPGISGLAETVRNLDEVESRLATYRAGSTSSTSYGADDAGYEACVVPGAKLFAVGLNYADHVEEVGTVAPTEPYVFTKLPNTLNRPFGNIRLPSHVTSELDYEVELAVVVGRRVVDASLKEAAQAIAGYMVANDVSAREWQRTAPWPQMVKAKCLDGFLPIGPWLTTTSEVPDPRALTIESHVNGELRQHASTADLIFGPTELVSFLSAGITLEPGDVILTGTPSGSAFARDGKPWLRPGDRVRCSIQSLGHIENAID